MSGQWPWREVFQLPGWIQLYYQSAGRIARKNYIARTKCSGRLVSIDTALINTRSGLFNLVPAGLLLLSRVAPLSVVLLFKPRSSRFYRNYCRISLNRWPPHLITESARNSQKRREVVYWNFCELRFFTCESGNRSSAALPLCCGVRHVVRRRRGGYHIEGLFRWNCSLRRSLLGIQETCILVLPSWFDSWWSCDFLGSAVHVHSKSSFFFLHKLALVLNVAGAPPSSVCVAKYIRRIQLMCKISSLVYSHSNLGLWSRKSQHVTTGCRMPIEIDHFRAVIWSVLV